MNPTQHLLFLIPVVVLVGCRSGVTDDEIVARVDNAVLSREQMERKMSWEGVGEDQESDFVDRWVNRELLYREAKRLGLDQSEELRWELELVEREYVIQMLLKRTFAQMVEIAEDEIASYYENHKEEFRIDEDEVRALHILTKTRAEANVARQEIIAGKPFEDAAREHSVGIFKENGGNMGFFRRGDVIPEIERNAFRLSVGRVSSIFQSNYGFHIIKVIKKRARGDYKDPDDVRDEITSQLRVNKERSAYYDLLFRLQNQTDIYVSIPREREEEADTTVIKTQQNGLED
jgi:peptidyl-prolyl cis-trans isomerase C